MKVYVLIEENSPELARECGGYELIAVYTDYNKACAEALKRAEKAASENFEIVDKITDDTVPERRISYSLYLFGEEDGSKWYTINVEPMESDIK